MYNLETHETTNLRIAKNIASRMFVSEDWLAFIVGDRAVHVHHLNAAATTKLQLPWESNALSIYRQWLVSGIWEPAYGEDLNGDDGDERRKWFPELTRFPKAVQVEHGKALAQEEAAATGGTG